MNEVLVLLSTYNGEKYLKEQLDSILNQERVAIHILIRDDGSSDSTLSILYEYQKKFSNVEVYCGENIGFTYSFYNLIQRAKKHEYYALADQDDIWKKNKMIEAIEKMKDEYIMYASNLTLVDENLNILKDLYENYKYENNLLNKCFPFYNPFGCSIVWKNSLQEKIYEDFPEKRIPHDLWMHISGHFNGKVYIDKDSFILHRLHSNNACGIGNKFITRFKKLIKFYLSDFRTCTDDTLREAIKIYGLHNLKEDEIELINRILNYKKSILKKIRLLNSKEMRDIKIKRRLEFSFLILVNKF